MFQQRASRRSAVGRSARSAALAVLAVGTVLVSAAPAVAAPPPNPTDGQLGSARAQQQRAAAEVGRIAGLVAAAQSDLERADVQAEAAGTASLAADEALQEAEGAAEKSAAQLATAAGAVSAAEARIARFSHDSYMGGSRMARSAALLDSAGPGELIQRAAMLDYVAANQLDVLGQLQLAKIRQLNADSAARRARDTQAAAQAAAVAAKQAAEQKVAAQQSVYAAVAAKQATYARQLKAAQIRLLQLQGARNAYRQWVAQRQAEAAAAAAAARREAEAAAQTEGSSSGAPVVGSSNYVRPAAGRVSSCFGWRWGALHAGLDLAAAIGTPVYAATSGTVRRAGPATGFGLALYIEGDDGAVTVYGHVNRYFVDAGQRVSAGEQIAEVGNRGQSTGPHLHFEVHPSGRMYSGAVDPVPWLSARGISVGGCGG